METKRDSTGSDAQVVPPRRKSRRHSAIKQVFGPLGMVMLLGSILWPASEYADGYAIVRVAAALHLLGSVTKWRNRTWNVLLIVSFSLYTVFLARQLNQHPLLAVLVAGGLFEFVRNLIKGSGRWRSYSNATFPVLVFLLSLSVTRVPNVLLQDKHTASVAAEQSFFFFRPVDPRDAVVSDAMVVWQEPAQGELRPCFAVAQQALTFLPFPVWPTLKYKLGQRPTVRITHLRIGHGTNSEPLVPVQPDAVGKVTQFHRVYGTFRNLSKDNDQLHLRVLILPPKSLSRFGSRGQRWCVQPHDASRDDARLNLTFEDANSGTWYCDAFFGVPEDRGELFHVMAVITGTDIKRGQTIPLADIHQFSLICDRVCVLRED